MLASLPWALLLAATATPLFERLVPLEVETGLVRLRTVEAPLLEVPEVGEWKGLKLEAGDWSETRFARLYRMEFFLEVTAEGKTTLEERGALLIAARMEDGALQELDRAIHDRLHDLGTDSFDTTLAGFWEEPSPMERLRELSSGASWICIKGKGFGEVGRADVYVGRGISSIDTTGRVCATLWQAAEGAAVDEIRALASPRRVREVSVRVEDSPIPAKEIPATELAALPSGTTFTRGEARKDECGGTMVPAAFGHSRCDGIAWDAQTEPASIAPEVLDRHAFLSRWTLEDVERTLGSEPRRQTRSRETLLTAFIPVHHSSPVAGADERVRVRLELDTFRTDLARRLAKQAELSLDVLERELTRGSVRELADLLLVVCRPDETAWFGLLPTKARNTVTNAPLFCAAMERMLP